jgi:hypothetical protein
MPTQNTNSNSRTKRKEGETMISEQEQTNAAPYQEMERRDEDLILQEMKGQFIETFVYSFKQGGRDITSLSYVGVKEAIRRRGGVQIVEYKVEEINGKYRATVLVHDKLNDIDVLGASEAEIEKPFAYVLALNKAERNAFSKIIPAKFFAELINEKLNGVNREQTKRQVVDVTPKPAPKTATDPKQVISEIPEGLTHFLTFETADNTLVVKKNTEQLDKSDFKTMCEVAERFGGKYNKDGTWTIPILEAKQ